MRPPPETNALAGGLAVLLGADSLAGRRSGVGRVVLSTARALLSGGACSDLRLLIGREAIPARPESLDALAAAPPRSGEAPPPAALARIAARVPGLVALRHAAERRRLDAIARELRRETGAPVLYHEPNMILRPFSGVCVAAINDLAWKIEPRWHPADRVAWMERRLPESVGRARRIVAISQYTAGEIVRHLGVARDRIDVVPLAADPAFRPMTAADAAPALARHAAADRAYVLTVSTVEPRKNFDRLLAAHQALPAPLRARYPLLLAGGRGWGEALSGPAARAATVSGELRLLGHVADDDLRALYARCAVFAFPSLYEGFGLPVIEAMACGAPVVASATTAVGEVAAGCAVTVEPEDTDSIRDGLQRVLEDAELQERLRAAGLGRAAEFGWDRVAAGLVASWRRALAEA